MTMPSSPPHSLEWLAALTALLAFACGGGASSDDGGSGDPLAAPIRDGAFLAEAGLVVVDFESLDAPGSWVSETLLSGFTGSSYLRWAGANHFATPGIDTFACDVYLAVPGTYQLRIHNRHEHPNSTEANDVWARMDGGDWIKTFSWQRGQWTWVTQHELGHGSFPEAQYTLSAGNHRLEFSGRSTDFCMDRFHLYLASVPNPLDTGHPQSPRYSASAFTAAGDIVDRRSLPAAAHTTALVVLDSGAGDRAAASWRVPGAAFVDGTDAHSPRAHVVLTGGSAVPVELTLSPSARDLEPTVRTVVLQVEGSPWTARGPLRVGRAATLERPLGAPDAWHLTAPSGATEPLEAATIGALQRASFTPSMPGEWCVQSADGRPLRFQVLP